MRKLKISIRAQLIILVCIVSIISLVILAVVTGVYVSDNMGDLRGERLEVVAQLKATQLEQTFGYLYYQIYWLSSRDTITSALTSYKAGNTSSQIFSSSESSMQQFLDASNIFTNARLYDIQFNLVVDASSNTLGEYNLENLTTEVLDVLYPFSSNSSYPAIVQEYGGYVVPPILNGSNYYTSLTFPVYSNSSFLITTPLLSGYISVAANAESLRSILNYSSAVKNGRTSIVRPIHNVPLSYPNASNSSTLTGYKYVFPPGNWMSPVDNITEVYFDISSYDVVQNVFSHNSTGYSRSVRNTFGEKVSVGFSIASLSFIDWAVVVEQKRSTFVAPVFKLRNIIIGVVIGICVFLCVLTFPLAYLFVRPISKLKAATEIIPKNRSFSNDHLNENEFEKLNIGDFKRLSANSNSSHPVSFKIPLRIHQHNRFFQDELTELTETFNIMTEELEKQYMHLEDRVKLRTKELEASKIQAESANEAKTVFIANISHELRTPLNGILGMTAIAMAEDDPLKIHDSLKLIYTSGELLLHILTELLTFSKNTLNRSKLEKGNFQILEITNQVKSVFHKSAKDSGVNFRILIKSDDIRRMILFGDSNRMIQVVMNLVSNSLKFTPVDGNVNVTVKLLGEYDYARSKLHNHKKVYVLNTTEVKADCLKSESDTTTTTYVNEEVSHESTSNSGSSNGIEPTDDDNSTSDQEDIDDATKYNRIIFNKNHDKNSPIMSPISGPFNSNYIRQRVDSIASKVSTPISLNEELDIEKDAKTYETRKLSQKKTWVVEISVEDTGPGIEPALQSKVFEPFIQGDQTLSRSYGGTGLGLSICRQLAKIMKGTLTLESNLGVGSKFIFTVPLTQTREIVIGDDEKGFYEDEFNIDSKRNRKVVIDESLNRESLVEKKNFSGKAEEIALVAEKDEQESALEDEVPDQISKMNSSKFQANKTNEQKKAVHLKLDCADNNLEKSHLSTVSSTGTAPSSKKEKKTNTFGTHVDLRIMVAEDNFVNQEVVKRMLKLEGFTNIKMACDGQEAVEFFKISVETGELFDIIFMDVQMPKIDGLLATKMIRTLDQNIPIIAFTAFADDSNVKECFANGMSGFLPKPVRRTQLKKILAEFCPIVLGIESNDKEKTV